MTAPPGFALLDHLIADHLVDRGGKPSLVPCLHEELDNDIDLLDAGARRCGGVLYHLSGDSPEWEAPPGPVSADRLTVLEGLLAGAGAALPGRVVVRADEHGGVIAELAGSSTPTEPSLQLILRCAAVITSNAYDAFDLVVITANIAGMDAHRRELLWRMLTIDPVDLTISGAPSTIVPVLGTRIDPDIDYRRTPGVRYVVRWDRVIRRSTLQHAGAIASIGRRNQGPTVLFLGAGASASANIPLGNAYRDLALTELVGQRDPGASAAEAFFDYLHEHQRFMPGDATERATFAQQLTLERVLRETFNTLGYRPRTTSPVIQELIKDCSDALQHVRPGRRALRELAARLPGQLLIITVNFDQLVETDLGVDCSVYFRPEHFKDRLEDLTGYLRGDSSRPLPILKLHGSIQDPDSLIATVDKTSAGLHEDVRSALDEILQVADAPITWVWVGCSMRDRDMNLWLGGKGADAFDEWWVDPLPGLSLDEFVQQQRTARWAQVGRQLRERLIVDSADGFLVDLVEQVRRS